MPSIGDVVSIQGIPNSGCDLPWVQDSETITITWSEAYQNMLDLGYVNIVEPTVRTAKLINSRQQNK